MTEVLGTEPPVSVTITQSTPGAVYTSGHISYHWRTRQR